MPRTFTFALVWIGIIALASFLRLHDLSDRPIHADEATGARILAERINNEHYIFNPKHFHGPILSLTSEPIARLRGESSWNQLSLHTLRLGPVIAGILLVLTPLLWRQHIGNLSTIIAGTLLATSPLLVYYSRMHIHESWLAFFGMLTCAAIFSFYQKTNTQNAIVTGLSIGLMFATKETFAISILSWTIAVVAVSIKQASFNYGRTYFKSVALLSLSAFALSAYLYSDGLKNLRGFVDALQTFFVYETTPGHEKPFYHYAELLIWPKHTLGTWWSEAFVFVSAIVASIAAIKHRSKTSIFITIGTTAHLVIYSFIAYKTPWLMLLPWALICLVASTLFSKWEKFSRQIKITISILMTLGLAFQIKQSVQTIGVFENDQRNPYAYVPTSKDTPKIEKWLSELARMPDAQNLEPIAVIGQGYWPLPWYLRDFQEIGYWPTISPKRTNLPIVFSMPEQIEACDQLLQTTHTRLPRSLRSNVPIILYLRNDIWKEWTDQPTP